MADDDKKPTEGDTYECKSCGMGILLTADCKCEDSSGAFFSCCGEQLEKKQRAS